MSDIDFLAGYRFRDLPRNNGLNPAAVTENLKSPEELENEDREAQSAVGFSLISPFLLLMFS